MKIVVLGGYGEMGSVISADLSKTAGSTEIIVAGRDGKKADALAKSFRKRNVKGVEACSGNKDEMDRALEGAGVLINASNYYSNIEVMQSCLRNGVNYIDLGGMYHTSLLQLKLGSSFRRKKLVAVIGCGSTPGITNLMALHGSLQFDRINSVDIAFSDYDKTEYNMPFVVPYSMHTVFDEFTSRPAVFNDGKMTFAEPLSGEKVVDFPDPVGKATCYYSLHSELATLPKAFSGKGIRDVSFRGGWDKEFMRATKFLIDAGFASKEKTAVGESAVAPRDVTVKLLNKFIPGRDIRITDLEYLKVELKGSLKGSPKALNVYCKSVTNRELNISAGSWDTGVPPSIVAQEILKGRVSGHGVMAPESCVNPDLFFRELATREIKIFEKSGAS